MKAKITDIRMTVVARETPSSAYAPGERGLKAQQEQLLVTVCTDQGVEGHCFTGSHARGGAKWATDSIVSVFKPMLVGQDAFAREALWSRMWALHKRKSLSPFALAAIDVALWDIAGKLANLPVYQLLGTAREKVPTCGSSMFWDDPAQYPVDALSLKERKYHAIKIFTGGAPKRDIGICEAVRKAVGPDTDLLLDSCFSYNRMDALLVGRAVEQLGFKWYEDPLTEMDVEGYAALSKALDIPVAAGDAPTMNIDTLPQFILKGAVDIVRADVAFKGGITPLKKVGEICSAFGVGCEFHHGGNSLMNVANLHVLLSLKSDSYYEIMEPASLQNYGLTSYVTPDTDGFVQAPQGAGLGFDVDWERIERDKVAQV